jgi:hypothetical protein
MLVRCVHNTGRSLPKWLAHEYYGLEPGGKVELTVGREYVVYAMVCEQDCSWVYVCDDFPREYPHWYPLPLFAISDGKLPGVWRVGAHPRADGVPRFVIAYPEWAADPFHYEKLTNGDEWCLKVFAKYRDLLGDTGIEAEK